MKFEKIPIMFFNRWKIIVSIIVLFTLVMPLKSIWFNHELSNKYLTIVYYQFKAFLTSFLMISFILFIQVYNPLCDKWSSNLFLIFFVGCGLLAGVFGLFSIPFTSTTDIYTNNDLLFSAFGIIVGTIIMYYAKIKRLEKKTKKCG